MLTQSIYQVFIRNHTEEGTIKELIKDLERIQSMGFDILYLMPFHPISVLNRKGTYGSPYAIANYYAVSEDLGTMDDLQELINKAHSLKMKVIMDIVFNHTGRDHTYISTHPEFYVLDQEGHPTARVADWYDIADFNFDNKNLWEELFNVLSFWANKSIDGVRCDVASLIPLEFWKEARQRINSVHSDFMWFSESIDLDFLHNLRRDNHLANSDVEILSVFDGSYDYDLWKEFSKLLKNEGNIDVYCALVNYQAASLSKGRVKWRFIENHDQPRSMSVLKRKKLERLWLSYIMFLPGMAFVYAGQESYQLLETPLFEKEVINRNFDEQLCEMITRLNQLRKEIYKDGVLSYRLRSFNNILSLVVYTPSKEIELLLNIDLESKFVEVINGVALNLRDGSKSSVNNGKIELNSNPILMIR